MASDTDAARDRVTAARADMDEQLMLLRSSAKAAVDIPAKIRRSPAKAAAAVGGVGFLALKGPQRAFGALRRAVRGPDAPLPDAMLPDDIEKTLRRMGSDGAKVRGLLEHDFADYLKGAQKSRRGLATAAALAMVRPIVMRSAKAAAEYITSGGDKEIGARIGEVREGAERRVEKVKDAASSAVADAPRPRRRRAAGTGETETEPPIGI